MRRLLFLAGGLVVLAVIAVVAYVGVTLWRDDDPELLTEAPAIPTSAAPATVSSSPAGSAVGADVLRFVVDPAQSSATYVVREKIARLPVETDASGTTADVTSGDVTGKIYLTTRGLAADSKSAVRVDLNTLRSDESLRDRFVRDSTLQTNRGSNRYADFTLESATGFPTSYVEGQEVALKLTGAMTLHGVTKPITFDVKARRQGEFLTATADTSFNMSEFGITPPNVSTARSHDLVRLQVVLVSRLAVG